MTAAALFIIYIRAQANCTFRPVSVTIAQGTHVGRSRRSCRCITYRTSLEEALALAARRRLEPVSAVKGVEALVRRYVRVRRPSSPRRSRDSATGPGIIVICCFNIVANYVQCAVLSRHVLFGPACATGSENKLISYSRRTCILLLRCD